MVTWALVAALVCLQCRPVWCLSTCCLGLRDLNWLIRCVEDKIRMKDERISDVVFSTFASENILAYAGSNALVNSLYLRQRNSDYFILSERTGDDHFPADRRWNKIKAIANGLQSWAHNSSFLVFMDADLVILDPYFDVLSIIAQYPSANLILATDEIDVANTGFMIVRNVPWSVDFFDRWWAAKDTKDTFCDQHVLNKLLEDPVDRSLVAIVPAKTMNSKWPVVDNFATGDPVLHLMGETHEVRVAVSQYLAEMLCTIPASAEVDGTGAVSTIARNGPLQLTKEKLVEIKQQTLTDLWEKIKTQCENEEATEKDFDHLHENVGQKCDPANRPTNQPRVFDMCASMLRQAMTIHEAHLNLRPNKLRVVHLKHLSMLQYDMLELSIAFAAQIKADTKHSGLQVNVFEVAQLVLSGLENLEDSLDMQVLHNRAYIHHKRGMVFGELGRHHAAAQQWEAAAEKERACIEELSQALQVTSEAQDEFRAFVLSYIHAAARLAQALRELDRLREAEDWANVALNNAKLLYSSTSNEERLRTAVLRNLHVLCRSIYVGLRDQAMVALHTREIDSFAVSGGD